MQDRDDPRIDNEFSGEAESVIQAGTVYGGVHLYASKSPKFPPPRQLPGGAAKFVNRADSLGQLNALLASLSDDVSGLDSPAVVIPLIAGAPGVGKTTLALHWAHQARHRFPDGDLYIDMHGYGPEPSLTAGQALDSFLRSLNVIPELIPVNIDERAALYRSLIGDKKMLIVIDNAASAGQIRSLLPGSRRCVAVVTTRGSLASLVAREGATRVTLDVLSPDDAVRLFADVVGEERVENENAAALRIAELCSYLPLALRVVAERATGRPHTSLMELVGELVSEQNRLDALASEEDQLIDVRAVFSWSYRALPPEQQKLFRSIGLHPGSEFSSAAAAALVDQPASVVNYQLQQLAKVHLVQEVSTQRYSSHDLLRAYSAERCQHEERPRERTHAVRRMLNWYLLTADGARRVILPYSQALKFVLPENVSIPSLDNIESAMSWYEQERLNILAALQQAMDLGQYDLAWKLSAVSDGFFELRSYWQEWRDIHTEALAAAQIIGDDLGEASARRCLGDVCWRTGEYDAALAHYELGATIGHKIGDSWIEGFSIRGAGLIYQERQQISEAGRLFEQARSVFEEAGLTRGVGMSLLSLGKCYRSEGDLQSSVEFGERAISVFREISDRWSLAWGLIPLGEAYGEMRSFGRAIACLNEAAGIFATFADRRSEALTLRQLGTVCLHSGDAGRASECWTRAFNIFEELGDPNAADVRLQLDAM